MVRQLDNEHSIRSLALEANICHVLSHWAEHVPGRSALTFESAGSTTDSLTYYQLNDRVHRIAAYLGDRLSPQDRVLLWFPPGLEFVQAFFGCLLANVIAVPSSYPRPGRSDPRLESIIRDSDPALVLSTSHTIARHRQYEAADTFGGDRLLGHPLLALDDAYSGHTHDVRIDENQIAFLQYTSGSTSEPKGVMVSHRNVMANLEAIRLGFQLEFAHSRVDRPPAGVFWLPSYHDMGLIGAILTPLYVGGQSYLLSPRDFLLRPLRWLQAIDRQRALISGAPDFGYQLCVEKTTAEQRADLNLQHWQLAFCGAEPIRLSTLERFADAFSASGFNRGAFYPCYGLAESTLLAAGGQGPGIPRAKTVLRDALQNHRVVTSSSNGATQTTLVACGQAALGQEVKIVDPDTRRPCASDEVGEVWVRGSSNALGYWNRPQETQETFQAYVEDDRDVPYLRTGDYGFLDQNTLYVTGRLKDVIILRGRNYYPQDLELTASSSHPALNVNGAVTFSVDVDNVERLVIMQEVNRDRRDQDWQEVASAIRRSVAVEHEIDPYAIVLLRHASLPRTTSGKIQRQLCRQRYRNDELACVARFVPGQSRPAIAISKADQELVSRAREGRLTADQKDRLGERIEGWILDWLQKRAQVPRDMLDRERPFAEFGLDSLQVVELSRELETWLKIPLTPVLAWNHPTPAKLAPYLASEVAMPADEAAPEPSRSKDERPTREFEQMLTEIESLSEEEAEDAALRYNIE